MATTPTAGLSASVQANLTDDTYIKLALSITIPLVVYVLLLVMTKRYR
ncbi:MAG TPA: hypothetical protein VK152_11615 [Paludibacter sp.]|nr:hypothetical protein [Paludibacter sp.]